MKSNIKPWWLNQTNSAKSCGVAVNTFKSWGVKEVHIDNGQKYYVYSDIEEARLKFKTDSQLGSFTLPNGVKVDYELELALKTQQDRIRLELANKEKIGELLPVDMFIEAVSRIGSHWGSSLDSLVLNIKRQVPEIKSSVLNIIDKLRINMQNELADWDMGIQGDIKALQKSDSNDTEDQTTNS